MGKKGKKGTPAELDFIFDRELIDEDQYHDFWGNWWKADESQRKKIISNFLDEEGEEEEEGGGSSLPLRGVVTKNRKVAEDQARSLGGYVRRRNSSGRFSKRGRFYQAIRRRKK